MCKCASLCIHRICKNAPICKPTCTHIHTACFRWSETTSLGSGMYVCVLACDKHMSWMHWCWYMYVIVCLCVCMFVCVRSDPHYNRKSIIIMVWWYLLACTHVHGTCVYVDVYHTRTQSLKIYCNFDWYTNSCLCGNVCINEATLGVHFMRVWLYVWISISIFAHAKKYITVHN
jgi:hypothetical protein